MEIIVVGAGKGGVGKSTVTCQLAHALKQKGFRVGVLDADVYGPSIDAMLPCDKPPGVNGDRLMPAVCQGIKLMSVAYFHRKAAVVRAPIANETIQRFFKQTDWGELDYLLVDLPPGTGDVQLSVLQTASVSGAILVTTPQEVALLDVRKAHECFTRLGVPILGLIENMAYFQMGPDRVYPFGEAGGERLARELKVELLGRIPIKPTLSLAVTKPDEAFNAIAHRLCLESSHLVKKVFLAHPKELVIEWTDGGVKRYDLGQVQLMCPCVRCMGKARAVRGDVSAKGVTSVGRYGIKIEFTSGCSSGIYSFELLQQMRG